MSESWTQRFLVWGVLVWMAVAIGGGVSGVGWGLAGFDCDGGPGRLEDDTPCPVASDPTISELVSYALAGGIALGMAGAALGPLPALVFAVSASALGWVLHRVGLTRLARWAPWIVLSVGAGAALVWMVTSGMVTALWAWAGLIVAVGLTAVGMNRAGFGSGSRIPDSGHGLFPASQTSVRKA